MLIFSLNLRQFSSICWTTVFIILTSNTIYGESKPDSLRTAIIESSKDLNRLGLLYAGLSMELTDTNIDSALFFAKKGLQISEASGNNEGIIKNCMQLGRIAIRKDQLSQALKFYERAIGLFNDKTDSVDQMKIRNGSAYLYDLNSDFSRALYGYMKGLEIAERTNNDLWKSYFYNNIAVIYDRTGSYRKGLGYYKKAMALFEIRNDSAYYANSLINIGLSYKNLNKADSANYFFNKSLPLQQRLKNYYGISNLYNILGEIKLDEKNLPEALNYFQLSAQMINNLDSLYWGSKMYLKVQADFNFGRVFQQMKEYGKSMEYYKNVKTNSCRGSFLSFETEAVKGISEIFEIAGRADSALKYARLYQVLYDSLTRIGDKQQLAVIEFEFNYKKEQARQLIEKEREEGIKKRQETKLMFLIAGILLIAVILFLLILLQRSKINRINLVKANLQLEKSHLTKDIDLKNRELTAKVMSLIEKNELLVEMSERLKKILENSGKSEPEVLRSVLHDLQHQHTEGFWEEFEVHFMETHIDFYTRLGKEFPELSPNEMKLCAFLKMNLSTKEISQITRKNEHSLKIARYRLRQKLGLSREENLVMFFSRF